MTKSTMIRDLMNRNSNNNREQPPHHHHPHHTHQNPHQAQHHGGGNPRQMPEDEAVVAEVLSEIEQPPMQQHQQQGDHNAPAYVMTPEMHEQFERQRMLQAQIEHQQELLNQREAQLEQRQTETDAAVMHMEEMAAAASFPVPGDESKSTSMLGSVASTLTELVGSVFRLNVRQIMVAAALFMLFQYVNITVVVNAVMRAFRMREFPCSANVDNGLVAQVARAVMFGTLVSVGNSVAA